MTVYKAVILAAVSYGGGGVINASSLGIIHESSLKFAVRYLLLTQRNDFTADILNGTQPKVL